MKTESTNIAQVHAARGGSESTPLPVGLSFRHELYDLADTVVKTRAIRALQSVAANYPIHRTLRCAARRKLEEVFDDLALKVGLTALRLDETTLLLDGTGVFIHAEGRRKADYCSCAFAIWSDSVERAEEVRARLLLVIGERYATEDMVTIDWHFMHARSGLTSASFDELSVDAVHDEAYPDLGRPVPTFIEEFLRAPETVLILQGSPGSGKTRLVRAILGAISRRKNDSAKVMYTADQKALQNDEIFVDFITGAHDAFVIEDADHLLLARSSGNHDLHRFLMIADGVVRAQGRKIIFTTNLPNLSDIDDALLRPGRCFANVRTRLLRPEEAMALAGRLLPDEARRHAALAAAFPAGVKAASLASIYRACAAQKLTS